MLDLVSVHDQLVLLTDLHVVLELAVNRVLGDRLSRHELTSYAAEGILHLLVKKLGVRHTSSGKRSTFCRIALGWLSCRSRDVSSPCMLTQQTAEKLCVGGHIDHADDIELGAQQSLVADGLAGFYFGLPTSLQRDRRRQLLVASCHTAPRDITAPYRDCVPAAECAR